MVDLKRKNGDITDMFVFLVTVFILGIGLFILAFVTPEIADGLRSGGLNDTSEGAQAIQTVSDIGTITIQRGFFFLFVGLIISVMITSFFANTHPIFLFLYILFLGVSIFLATFLGNAYELVAGTSIFSDTLQSQTLINLVLNNIVIIVLAVGALSFVIVFAKFRSGSRGASL